MRLSEFSVQASRYIFNTAFSIPSPFSSSSPLLTAAIDSRPLPKTQRLQPLTYWLLLQVNVSALVQRAITLTTKTKTKTKTTTTTTTHHGSAIGTCLRLPLVLVSAVRARRHVCCSCRCRCWWQWRVHPHIRQMPLLRAGWFRRMHEVSRRRQVFDGPVQRRVQV